MFDQKDFCCYLIILFEIKKLTVAKIQIPAKALIMNPIQIHQNLIESHICRLKIIFITLDLSKNFIISSD